MGNALQLDASAFQLLAKVQNRRGAIDQSIQGEIQKAAQAKGSALSAKDLEAVLLQAMPGSKEQIGEASKGCATSRYQCDGKKGDFLTQITGFRIEKEEHRVVNRSERAPGRDPLFADLIMDKDAGVVLLFNARDVDEKGRPLLIKAVVREGASLDAIDMSGYRTKWAAGAPDVMSVAKNAAHVSVADMHETEFAFGDPIVQVSFGPKGEEISRGTAVRPENKQTTRFFGGMWQQGPNGQNVLVPNPATGDQTAPQVATGATLDTTFVATFDDKIRIKLAAKEGLPEGSWLEAPAKLFAATLRVEPGLVFEPESQASVRLLGASVNTAVPADDAFLVGSPGGEAAVDLAPLGNHAVSQLLAQPVTRTSGTAEKSSDRAEKTWTVKDLVYANAKSIQVGAGGLAPLQDVTLKATDLEKSKITAEYSQVSGQSAGVKLHLTVGEGFLSAKDGASVAGWTMVVGYRDQDGKWHQGETRKIGSGTTSEKQGFEFDLANTPALYKKNAAMEIRLFNADGIPAERVLLPMKEIGWAD